MALLLKTIGEYSESQQLFGKVYEGYKKLFGEEHPSTIIVMQNLGALYKVMGSYNNSRDLF